MSLKRNKSSLVRRCNNNKSMGWLGELSSMVLSMGQKLIQTAEKCTSDATSEMVKVEILDLSYKPLSPALIDKLY